MKIYLLLNFLILLLLISCTEISVAPEPIKEYILNTNNVVFFSSDKDENVTNIFMMTPSGELIKQITKFTWGEFVATALSPDSNQLLFYQAAPGLGIDVGMDIYIYKIKEDTVIGPITQGHPGNFSPDGKKIILSKHFSTNGGYESIFIFDLTNNSEERLTYEGNSCFFPKISPDGNYICYESSVLTDSLYYWQLHLMDINGAYIKNLTLPLGGYYAGDPNFTPDGGSVVFRYEERVWCFDICKVDLNNNNISYLTDTRYNGNSSTSPNFYNPFVNKADNKVYFHSKKYDANLNLVAEIFTIELDGTSFKQITNNNSWNSNPVAGNVTYYVEK